MAKINLIKKKVTLNFRMGAARESRAALNHRALYKKIKSPKKYVQSSWGEFEGDFFQEVPLNNIYI